MSTTAPFSELKTPEQIAEQFQLKKTTIWTWCREGKIPHIKLSRRCYRLRDADVEDFLNNHSR
jgi:excisionase family DNA binding protein